ncbi:hypothetical protein HDV00_012592 [Rhizophlyctis rosea]|nr:hypothetical protein HDV00_012592 [Rhizophlyctis rosea]
MLNHPPTLTTVLLGELCNLAAYAFSPAVLVTPLGALSVVISAILSAFLLKEKLNFSGQVGCAQCIIGAVILVLNAPATQSTTTIASFFEYAWTAAFIAYASVNLLLILILMFYLGPRYGDRYPIVPIAICSLSGAFVVAATQGVGAAVVHSVTFPMENQFKDWRIYPLIVFILITGAVQINYLNKALNIYSTAVVTPIYYVCFTSATLLCSAILLRQFAVEDPVKAATAVLGFVVIVGGVSLLFAFSLKETRKAERGVQLLSKDRDIDDRGYQRFDDTGDRYYHERSTDRLREGGAGRYDGGGGGGGEVNPFGKVGGRREDVFL